MGEGHVSSKRLCLGRKHGTHTEKQQVLICYNPRQKEEPNADANMPNREQGGVPSVWQVRKEKKRKEREKW